jgi:hypothetical protein
MKISGLLVSVTMVFREDAGYNITYYYDVYQSFKILTTLFRSDDELPWDRVADDELDTKYPYVCHAELNAILNKNSADVKGCKVGCNIYKYDMRKALMSIHAALCRFIPLQ